MMKLFFYLTIILATIASVEGAGENSKCATSARVRKSWDKTPQQDRDLYVEATNLALGKGLLAKVTDLHVKNGNYIEAHYGCGFGLWHRLYLLLWENILRSQGPKYQCVTIPFWDSFTHFQKQADGDCTNMQKCSPITEAFGTNPDSKSTSFSGRAAGGKCYGSKLTEYCDDNNVCACVPREDLTGIKIPAGSGWTSIFSDIVSSGSYIEYSRKMQGNVHNEMHDRVGGYMRYGTSPTDPLFFSWHATVDMLIYTFHQCKTGNQNGVPSPFDFGTSGETCSTRANAVVTKQSSIQMNTIEGPSVFDSPILKDYVQGLGQTYADFIDVDALGEFKYSYLLPDDMSARLVNSKALCPNGPVAVTQPPATTEPTPTPGTTDAPTTNAPGTDGPTTGVPGTDSPSTDGPSTDVPGTDAPGTGAPGTTDAPSTNAPGTDTPSTDAPGTNAPGTVTPGSNNSTNGSTTDAPTTDAPTGSDDSSYWKWYNETLTELIKKYDGNMTIVMKELGQLECVYYQEKFGVTEISAEFVQEMNLSSSLTACGKVVKEVENGTIELPTDISQPQWSAPPQAGGTPVVADSSSPVVSLLHANLAVLTVFAFLSM